MFGDVGHGLVLFLYGLYICISKTKELYTLRYLIILMGFFSFYAGLIYNDYLSLSLNLFDSCY